MAAVRELGAGNVKLTYARWPDLPDLPFRVLAYMALVSMDEDPAPSYWGGWEALALAAGRVVPDRSDDPGMVKVRRAALKAVNSATRTLIDRGAIRVKQAAAPGRNATYELIFANRTVHGERAPSGGNGARSADTTVHGEPTNGARSAGPTVHAQRAPEEYEEEVRTEGRNETADLDLTVTGPRAREAVKDPISIPVLRLVADNTKPARTGLGFCIRCYSNGQVTVAADPENGSACATHLREAAS